MIKKGALITDWTDASGPIEYYKISFNNRDLSVEHGFLSSNPSSINLNLNIRDKFNKEFLSLSPIEIDPLITWIHLSVEINETIALMVNISFSDEIEIKTNITYDYLSWKNPYTIHEFNYRLSDLLSIEFSEIDFKKEDVEVSLPDIFVSDINKSFNASIDSHLEMIRSSVRQVDEDLTGKNESITKCIEFPPQYRQAGISILNYFSRVVENKYPDTEIKLRIEQEGNLVRMIIETPEGEKEKIEQTLEEYGLVVTGQMLPEQFIDKPLAVIELQSQLELAKVQLQMNERLLLHSEKVNTDLSQQVKELTTIVKSSLSRQEDLTSLLSTAILNRDYTEELRLSLGRLLENLQSDVNEKDRDRIMDELRLIRNSNQGLYSKIEGFIFNSAASGTGSLLATWIQSMGV